MALSDMANIVSYFAIICHVLPTEANNKEPKYPISSDASIKHSRGREKNTAENSRAETENKQPEVKKKGGKNASCFRSHTST